MLLSIVAYNLALLIVMWLDIYLAHPDPSAEPTLKKINTSN